ncbi:unnamed protein product [Mytilus coruscus]|uniref:Uncharacterized protein n=1 Tax=Mytilus coruscus TaxID=42192 RepID=A0A6J8AUM3_MYTCO|nr:unnamed protein product [Mytilus coruscus]
MKKKNDKYHNLCRIKFHNTKLERPTRHHMSPMPSSNSSECKSHKVFRKIDDKVSRIRRALNPNAEDKDTQNMQVDETKKRNSSQSDEMSTDKKETTTDAKVRMDKNNDKNESSSLIKHEDLASEANVNHDKNKNSNVPASLEIQEAMGSTSGIMHSKKFSDRVDNRKLHHLEDWTLFKQQGKISESLIKELFESKDGSQFSGQKNNLHKVMEKLDIIVKIENSSYYIMPSEMPSSTFEVVCEKYGILTQN